MWYGDWVEYKGPTLLGIRGTEKKEHDILVLHCHHAEHRSARNFSKNLLKSEKIAKLLETHEILRAPHCALRIQQQQHGVRHQSS